jgi:predicted nuclease of predicted toxin-antitoxin system
MPVALYMDEHIPKAVTEGLRERGVDVITVQEDGLLGASDPEVLNRATETKRVVVTYDDDFLSEASRRLEQDIYFYGVIYVTEPRNALTGKLIEDLEIVAKAVEPSYFVNRKLEYLPL